jgi:hypothetical protein
MGQLWKVVYLEDGRAVEGGVFRGWERCGRRCI